VLARAGLHPTADGQARIAACEDTTGLDGWSEPMRGAHDGAQVLARVAPVISRMRVCGPAGSGTARSGG